jgi:hypothetical protein
MKKAILIGTALTLMLAVSVPSTVKAQEPKTKTEATKKEEKKNVTPEKKKETKENKTAAGTSQEKKK